MNVTVISWRGLQIVLVTFRLSIPLIGFSLSLVPYICLEVGIVKYPSDLPFKMMLEFPTKHYKLHSTTAMQSTDNFLYKRQA